MSNFSCSPRHAVSVVAIIMPTNALIKGWMWNAAASEHLAAQYYRKLRD
jgi:hypothetical protein